jgi:hypothetical protein
MVAILAYFDMSSVEFDYVGMVFRGIIGTLIQNCLLLLHAISLSIAGNAEEVTGSSGPKSIAISTVFSSLHLMRLILDLASLLVFIVVTIELFGKRWWAGPL